MNYILISGTSSSVAKRILQDIATMYHDTGFTEQIELWQHRSSPDLFMARFTFEPDFERFKYFTNYVAFPIDVEFDGQVRGYWTVTGNEAGPTLRGKRLMLFLSSTDSEADNVYAVSQDNLAFKFGFSVGDEYHELPQSEKPFQEQPLELADFLLLDKISPDAQVIAKQEKQNSGCVPMVLVMACIAYSIYML